MKSVSSAKEFELNFIVKIKKDRRVEFLPSQESFSTG